MDELLLSRWPWAKRNEHGEELSLPDHSLDVAMVFRALLELPNLARLGPLTEAQKDRLAVLAFLHDFGKCNWGFQAKALPNPKLTAGHVLEAFAFLEACQHRWPSEWRDLIACLCGWFSDPEQPYAMLLAALSHHGRPISWNDYSSSSVDRIAERVWSPQEGYDPLAAVNALALVARTTFPQAFASEVPRINATPHFQQRFAGLLMLADWIGSDTSFFPYQTSENQTRAAFAQTQAQNALRTIGILTPSPRESRLFAQVFGFDPSPLQKLLAEELAADDSSRLLLIESDTGSGKTEAALAWFFRLYASGKVDGLYFALPTRVAARELYERVRRAVSSAFDSPGRPQPVLLAVPGYVKFEGAPALCDPQGTLWHDQARDLRRDQTWAAERPKRFLAAPVAVGTVDQALLSVLKVKHSLLRSVCLDRHLLVVDEVHASDTYMRQILKDLLRGHLERGGWAVLLSATLGEAAASAFFQRQVKPLGEAVRRPYPGLETQQGTHPVPSRTPPRRIAIELKPTLLDDETLVPELIEALKAKARVLVVCNTVTRANTLFRRVEDHLQQHAPGLLEHLFAANGVRCPHHGRFARADRELLDAQVTALMGKSSTHAPLLLIGTQTLEQSLDIDADWLITDLAPMDVLIQRLGRLHRHPHRPRPQPFQTPTVLIRTPAKPLETYLEPKGKMKGPAGLGSVYDDGRVLQRTWEELRCRQEICLPEEARVLIERTTHPEVLAQLPAAWQRHQQWLEGERLAELQAALSGTLDNQNFGDLHYPDKSERVLTRLAEASLDLPLEPPCPSPFGKLVDRITIPAHLVPDLQGQEPPVSVNAEVTDDGFWFTIGPAKFKYTRLGLEKDDA